jgi:hypothetical protein
MQQKIGLFLAFIAILFAQWSKILPGNLMLSTYILIGMFRSSTLRIASVICGVAALS